MRQADVAPRGPAVNDVRIALGVQAQQPGVARVPVTLIGNLQFAREAGGLVERVDEEGVEQLPARRVARGTVGEGRQAHGASADAGPLQRIAQQDIAVHDALDRGAALFRYIVVQVGAVVMQRGFGQGQHAVHVVVQGIDRGLRPEVPVLDHGVHHLVEAALARPMDARVVEPPVDQLLVAQAEPRQADVVVLAEDQVGGRGPQFFALDHDAAALPQPLLHALALFG